ncbi:MAG: hypothetical protein HY516_02580 [Candidatus Aenigmarchaeota archaeon]|nr:hypothetical protein [Candidatus Aenigmarchaeota archaeon]
MTYADKTSAHGEKVLHRYGALTLTNKRVVGDENVIDLALGGMGKLISKFLGFSNKNVSGTVTEISLDKIDSIRLTLIREGALLKLSNLLWVVTLLLLLMIWAVAPYRSVSTAFVGVAGFILNLVTLGFLKDVIEPLLESLLSIISGSYDIPVMTFAASAVLFVAYMVFKTIRLEIHSAKNMVFTNILDLSAKSGIEEAQKFAKKVREAEEDHKKK